MRACLIAASSVCSVEQEFEVLHEAENWLEKTAAPVACESGLTEPSV